jgi:hypothetical protein
MGDTDTWVGFGSAYDGDDSYDYGSLNSDYGEDGSSSYRPVKSRTCLKCGTKGLHWTRFKDKWYLFNEHSELHQCKRDAIDVFKEVT